MEIKVYFKHMGMIDPETQDRIKKEVERAAIGAAQHVCDQHGCIVEFLVSGNGITEHGSSYGYQDAISGHRPDEVEFHSVITAEFGKVKHHE